MGTLIIIYTPFLREKNPELHIIKLKLINLGNWFSLWHLYDLLIIIYDKAWKDGCKRIIDGSTGYISNLMNSDSYFESYIKSTHILLT